MTQPLRLLPGGVPLEVVRGEPFAVVASFIDAAGDPLPLTGTFAAELLDRDAVPLAGGAMAVDATGAATGVLRVEASAAASALLVDSLHRWRLRDVSSDHTVLDGPVRPRPSGAAGVAAASFEVTAQVAMAEAAVMVSVMTTGSSGGGGGGADLSDATPAPLGVAAAGVDGEASRADHVHAMPTAGDVGALSASSGYNTAGGWLRLDEDGTIPDNRIPSSIARDSEVAGASGINYPANSILANNTGSPAPASGLSASDVRAMLALFQPAHTSTASGSYLSCGSIISGSARSSGGATSSTASHLSVCPIWVPINLTVDAIAMYQTTAATDSGSLIELGLSTRVPDNGPHVPVGPSAVVTLLASAGTTSATAAPGLRTLTFASPLSLTRGWYWGLCKFVTSTTAGTNPAFQHVGHTLFAPMPSTAPSNSPTYGVYGVSLGASASIPSTLSTVSMTLTNNSANYCWIALRIA